MLHSAKGSIYVCHIVHIMSPRQSNLTQSHVSVISDIPPVLVPPIGRRSNGRGVGALWRALALAANVIAPFVRLFLLQL